jgi:aminoglycoside 3-N-acetyltransferase
MSEADTIALSELPLTIDSLTEQFTACGLAAGQTVLVHTRMSALGWIVGGGISVIHALLRVLTPSGTLMMPTFSAENTDPAKWVNPPVPEQWWEIIRQHMPAYNPRTTPTYGMGTVPELFRTFPGVLRSDSPDVSFAALGPNAEYLTANHNSLGRLFGDESPIGKLYELDGCVLLLGVDHGNNTSLHNAEYRTNLPKKYTREGTAMLVNGVRQWVWYDMEAISDEDFAELGRDYETAHNIQVNQVGRGQAHFMKQRPLIDFAVGWLEQHRKSEPTTNNPQL